MDCKDVSYLVFDSATHGIIMNLLGKIEYEFNNMKWKRNYHRKNASEGPCDSMSFGLVNRFEHGSHGKFDFLPSVNNEQWPKVYDLLQQLASIIQFEKRTGVPCSTFCTNRNFQCKLHRDRVNQGESIIVGLGDYEGGELQVLPFGAFDIRYRFLQFDGSKYEHGTLPFQGQRYSIVFYSSAPCKSKGQIARRVHARLPDDEGF